MNAETHARTRKLTTMAMLAAVAIVLVALVHFPLIPSAAFLEYDPADIPIFLCAFLYGPWAALALTCIVSVIQGLTVSAGGGVIGIVMHILATGTFVVLAGSIYRRFATGRGMLAALCAGTLAMTAVMVACNLVLTPVFLGAPVAAVVQMLLPAIIPFNLMKAGLNSVLTALVFAAVKRAVPGRAH